MAVRVWAAFMMWLLCGELLISRNRLRATNKPKKADPLQLVGWLGGEEGQEGCRFDPPCGAYGDEAGFSERIVSGVDPSGVEGARELEAASSLYRVHRVGVVGF